MYLVRDIMYCKPGKVRPMVEKFTALAGLMRRKGQGSMRVMTDVTAERYWTIVSEMEVESLDEYMSMGPNEEDAEEFEEIMAGYHDLVEHGRREIYKIEE